MSLGTPTIKSVRETRDGGQEILMSCAGDSAYPAGGTHDFNAFVRAAIKAKHLAATDKNVRGEEDVAVQHVIPVRAGVYVPSYDITNDKLFVYDNTTNVESVVADMHATTFEFVAVCK